MAGGMDVTPAELRRFAEQIPSLSTREGLGVRCSAYLTDGTHLPCVLLASPTYRLKLALRRFRETRSWLFRRRDFPYEQVVESFVITGNRVNYFDIERVDKSPYAIPKERLAEIRGETSMSWTEFTVVMDDGEQFPYGTHYLMEFFEMPQGYSGDRIRKIIPQDIGKPQFRGRTDIRVYRERPYFVCFVEGM
jgi:hypothetical protein